MDDFSIDILASAAGVAAITVAIIGIIRVVYPWNLSAAVLRIMSVFLGVGLAGLAAGALIGPEPPAGDSRLAVVPRLSPSTRSTGSGSAGIRPGVGVTGPG